MYRVKTFMELFLLSTESLLILSSISCVFTSISFFFPREKEGKGERKRGKHRCERHIDPLPLTRTPPGDRSCNPGMYVL